MGSDKEGSSSGDDSSDDAPTRKPPPSSDPGSDDDVENSGPRKQSGGSRWDSSGDRGTALASNHRQRSAGNGQAQGDVAVGGREGRRGKTGSKRQPSSLSDEDILAGLSEFSGSVGSRPAGLDESLDALGKRSSRVGVDESSGAGGRIRAAAAAGRRHQIRNSLSQVSVWDPKSPQTPSSLRVTGGEGADAGVGTTEAGNGVSGRSGGARVQAGGFALRVRWPDQVPMMTSHAADSPLAGSTTQVGGRGRRGWCLGCLGTVAFLQCIGKHTDALSVMEKGKHRTALLIVLHDGSHSSSGTEAHLLVTKRMGNSAIDAEPITHKTPMLDLRQCPPPLGPPASWNV